MLKLVETLKGLRGTQLLRNTNEALSMEVIDV